VDCGGCWMLVFLRLCSMSAKGPRNLLPYSSPQCNLRCCLVWQVHLQWGRELTSPIQAPGGGRRESFLLLCRRDMEVEWNGGHCVWEMLWVPGHCHCRPHGPCSFLIPLRDWWGQCGHCS
jgi:hypothetical protein